MHAQSRQCVWCHFVSESIHLPPSSATGSKVDILFSLLSLCPDTSTYTPPHLGQYCGRPGKCVTVKCKNRISCRHVWMWQNVKIYTQCSLYTVSCYYSRGSSCNTVSKFMNCPCVAYMNTCWTKQHQVTFEWKCDDFHQSKLIKTQTDVIVTEVFRDLKVSTRHLTSFSA